MDNLTSYDRSALMAKIKGRNTKPEIEIRKYLFSLGYRYRINVSSIDGSPDIVFPKYEAVIFVHGCFWHQHGCSMYKRPKSNTLFWNDKFKKNKNRDSMVLKTLLAKGWRVAIVWECSLSPKRMAKTGQALHRWLQSSRKKIEIPRSNK